MLVLSLKEGESMTVGRGTVIRLVKGSSGKARLGIDAPGQAVLRPAVPAMREGARRVMRRVARRRKQQKLQAAAALDAARKTA